ncbi:hypothetical protein [Ramlibacter tataouinensis]|uniref:Uncharacterized protein n=1 Tax=Ramlibacter tataouinensis (strain ATCC BAA-407 / DSM 14655 / LMG 21543 / TTB310) TaxID=365046 RepID=F5XYR0_RAMTT|nr:hypothetical protein [Ramlibacter tataouinensis]AEG94427.1 Hypothetical protein Rta_33150 [Ramlibacter tataouinensis TTB310]
MSAPAITATCAVWLCDVYTPHDLMAALAAGKAGRVVEMLSFHGSPDKQEFGDGYVRMGDADITIRLLPQDEQVRMAVQSLQRQLEAERARFHERQQALLREIGKLQALTFDGS